MTVASLGMAHEKFYYKDEVPTESRNKNGHFFFAYFSNFEISQDLIIKLVSYR